MPVIAFAIPILPGKEALDRDTFADMEGARRDDYEAALRDAGVTRHTVWHQETPDGTVAIVYMESQDEGAIASFASSDAPLNRWFRDRMNEVHGLDISQAGPPPQQVHDIRV